MTVQFQDDSVTIHRFVCGAYENNAYLVVCSRTNRSILIDLPEGAEQLVEAAKSTDVQAIVITHNHMDHIQGYDAITREIKARIGIGPADADALPKPPDFLLEDGSEIVAGDVTLKAIATPGHTSGSTCLVMGKHLFTGDTLFTGGPGRSRSPAALKQILESITTRLFVLDDDTVFYTGHGEGSGLKSAKDEHAVYASKQHPADLEGDVSWLES